MLQRKERWPTRSGTTVDVPGHHPLQHTAISTKPASTIATASFFRHSRRSALVSPRLPLSGASITCGILLARFLPLRATAWRRQRGRIRDNEKERIRSKEREVRSCPATAEVYGDSDWASMMIRLSPVQRKIRPCEGWPRKDHRFEAEESVQLPLVSCQSRRVPPVVDDHMLSKHRAASVGESPQFYSPSSASTQRTNPSSLFSKLFQLHSYPSPTPMLSHSPAASSTSALDDDRARTPSSSDDRADESPIIGSYAPFATSGKNTNEVEASATERRWKPQTVVVDSTFSFPSTVRARSVRGRGYIDNLQAPIFLFICRYFSSFCASATIVLT